MLGWLKRRRGFPAAVSNILKTYHTGGVTESDCLACSSNCCSHGGFAILENVLEIFRLYQQGGLQRPDFVFAPGLSFAEFVRRHFDVCLHELEDGVGPLMCFHMRSVGPTGEPIAVPAVGYYWETRKSLFERNLWLNRGCVFLSEAVPNWPEDDGKVDRRCLLHSERSLAAVTAKPIDCVFFTCRQPHHAKEPTADESESWFKALAEAFPRSKARYERMIGSRRAAEQGNEADEAR